MMYPENDLLTSALACFRKERPRDSHKGDYGRVLILAGSEGMTGAAFLCAKAALHMGTGLVYLAAPRGLLPVYESLLPEAVKYPVGHKEDLWFKEEHFTELSALSHGKHVVVLGPGLGSHAETEKLVRALLETPEFAMDAHALILDADGLNVWQRYRPELQEVASGFGGKMILTPHEGEMAGLTGLSVDEIHQNREQVAGDLASKLSGATVVLKGNRTVCTDGQSIYINTTGNPGMATGGSGDVLAGMIAGLAATDGAHLPILQIGAYAAALHGHCGDLAAKKYGQRFVTATYLIEEMGELCK